MKTTLEPLTKKGKKPVRAYVKRLSQEMGNLLHEVILFGSYARGDATINSDLDFAVIVENADLNTRSMIRDLATEVWLEDGIYISTRVWSCEHWQRLKTLNTGLYQNIQQEGIDLLKALP